MKTICKICNQSHKIKISNSGVVFCEGCKPNLIEVKPLDDLREGFVVKFSNGFRIKLKLKDYCRLHSVITNVSTKDVWEYLRDGRDLNELFDRTPDEFDEWVRGQVKKLNEDFTRLENNCKSLFNSIYKEGISKKDFALTALQFKESSILFKMYEGKSYDHIIWNLIEPTFSKPFWNKGDEES